MLSPDMILEDIRYGEELEAKKEYYLAYWVYRYAESAEEREEEAICLIGSPKSFAEVEAIAANHRRNTWKLLNDEEKQRARQGVNPFGFLPEFKDREKPPYDYGWDNPCCYFYDDEDAASNSLKHRYTLFEALLSVIILILSGRRK